MKLKIGVIFGGPSLEHELSILTALQVMSNIDKERYEVVPIYITKDYVMYAGGIDSFKDFRLIERYAKRVNLVNSKGRFILQTTGLFKHEYNEIHLAFPIMHGKNGEDGTVQGYLKMLGIPYVGNDIYSSAITQDKVYTREILENNNFSVADYICFNARNYREEKEEYLKKISKMNFPVIIKPAHLGSSIGIEIVSEVEELEYAIERVLNHDDKIIVEKYIDKTSEFNVAVIHSKDRLIISTIEEIKKEGIMNYQDKCLKIGNDGTFERTYPAQISKNLKTEIEEYATSIYDLLGCKSCVRIDFIYDNKKKKLYVDEVNSIPNFLCYYLFDERNIDYKELLNIMIKETIDEILQNQKMVKTLDTDILKKINNRDIGALK